MITKLILDTEIFVSRSERPVELVEMSELSESMKQEAVESLAQR